MLAWDVPWGIALLMVVGMIAMAAVLAFVMAAVVLSFDPVARSITAAHPAGGVELGSTVGGAARPRRPVGRGTRAA